MTFGQVLMAAAMLVLGFMIWHLSESSVRFETDLTSKVDKIQVCTGKIEDRLNLLVTKVDGIKILRSTMPVQVGKPRVKPIPHMPRHELNFFEQMFQHKKP